MFIFLRALLVFILPGVCVGTGYYDIAPVLDKWDATTVQDLHKEYQNIFRYGNRNAASHLWATFLLQRAHQMSDTKLQLMFSGFCAVSGSPVRPSDYGRYQLSLPAVNQGGNEVGFMYYCCWPCVCDTQDFIRVDTKTVTTSEGTKKYRFAVIGNPCDHPEQLKESFVQPFGSRTTTLEREAIEVRCGSDGELVGATLSDHGYVIISLFFDAGFDAAEEHRQSKAIGPSEHSEDSADVAQQQQHQLALQQEKRSRAPQPGKISAALVGEQAVQYQDEYEYEDMCTDRAKAGYNSGMGEIFRRVASISPIGTNARLQ